MPIPSSPFNEQIDALKAARDDLRVRLHLGAEDVREDWEHAEVLWARLQGEMHRLSDVSRRPSRQLRTAAASLIHEVGVAQARIREALQRPV